MNKGLILLEDFMKASFHKVFNQIKLIINIKTSVYIR